MMMIRTCLNIYFLGFSSEMRMSSFVVIMRTVRTKLETLSSAMLQYDCCITSVQILKDKKARFRKLVQSQFEN